jgi:hypothetical protein
MSLADAIRGLANDVRGGLDEAWDFYLHTKAAWRASQQFALAGHTVEIRNRKAGVLLDAAQMDLLAQRYITVHLAQSVLVRFATLREDWVFGLLGHWLMAFPKGIPHKEKKSIGLGEFLDVYDLDTILRGVVDRELYGLKYERPAAWFKYLDDRVGLGCPTVDQIEALAEIKAARDLISHNRGLVNRTYLDKAGPKSRFAADVLYDVDEPYLLASWTLIRDVVIAMETAALAKAPALPEP